VGRIQSVLLKFRMYMQAFVQYELSILSPTGKAAHPKLAGHMLAARDSMFILPVQICRMGKGSFNSFLRKSRDRRPKQFLKRLNCLCMETCITLLIFV